MNKAVMISIQPYYVFLIIAQLMGWDIPKDKTIEVRKDFPKDKAWNRRVDIYCSKSKKSFNRIPKEYQPLMRPFLGKVIGEFYCFNIETYDYDYCDGVDIDDDTLLETMLDREEINIYAKGKNLYGWHISQLKIYDKPKGLSEFKVKCKDDPLCDGCLYFISCTGVDYDESDCAYDEYKPLTRPPQSWCYVEEL